jgi:LysR family transcriptional regulator, nitrogen assimilation regulatory protein
MKKKTGGRALPALLQAVPAGTPRHGGTKPETTETKSVNALQSILDHKWLVFMKVAELGSLTRAAAAFDVPQSMISRHIAQLERQCGTRLFRRTGRGVVLTDFGKQVMPRLQALITDAENIADEIRTAGGIPIGDVHVGMLPSTVPMAASQLFALVQKEFPRVRLHLSDGASAHLEEQLREGRIDMALLLREGQAIDSGETILSQTSLCVVGARGAPLLAEPTLPLAELQGVPLVVPSYPHPLRARLDRLAQAQGLKLNIAVEADSIRLQHEVAAAGGGFAISSGLFELRDDPRLASTRIVKPELVRSVVLATTLRRPNTLATREVHRLIERIMPGLLQ